MGYTYAKRQTLPTANVSGTAPKTALPGISNSSMLSVMGYHDGGGLPNLDEIMKTRVRALNNQIPAAESEADRLSEGVFASSPERLKEEMGERLGADFSSVRFHSDAASARRADRIGARAWTQGSDVYFGEGGFEPSVAAHELVHTVQQGAASGEVSQSVPMGTVQMAPWDVTKKQLKANKYNPTGDQTLEPKLAAIDSAETFQEAYRVFLNQVDGEGSYAVTENLIEKQNQTGTGWEAAQENDLSAADLKNFKAKLKNMMRVVNDFPELRGHIGKMQLVSGGKGNSTHMYSTSTQGGREKSTIGYNPAYDESRTKWQTFQRWKQKDKGKFAATRSYDGTHELGHVLNSLLFNPSDVRDGTRQPTRVKNALKGHVVTAQDIAPSCAVDRKNPTPCPPPL